MDLVRVSEPIGMNPGMRAEAGAENCVSGA
jgi:hypothetical protein